MTNLYTQEELHTQIWQYNYYAAFRLRIMEKKKVPKSTVKQKKVHSASCHS